MSSNAQRRRGTRDTRRGTHGDTEGGTETSRGTRGRPGKHGDAQGSTGTPRDTRRHRGRHGDAERHTETPRGHGDAEGARRSTETSRGTRRRREEHGDAERNTETPRETLRCRGRHIVVDSPPECPPDSTGVFGVFGQKGKLHQAFLRLGHLIVDHLPRSPTFLLLCAAFSALEPAVWSRE